MNKENYYDTRIAPKLAELAKVGDLTQVLMAVAAHATQSDLNSVHLASRGLPAQTAISVPVPL